jgi:alpha-tubulin suppressor-like RCC1 family protein
MKKIALISTILLFTLTIGASGQARYLYSPDTLLHIACGGLAEPTGVASFVTLFDSLSTTVAGTLSLQYNLPIVNTDAAATCTNRVQVTAIDESGALLTPQPNWSVTNGEPYGQLVGLVVIAEPAGYPNFHVISVSNVRVNVSAICGSVNGAVRAYPSATGNRLGAIGENFAVVYGVARPLRTPVVSSRVTVDALNGMVLPAAASIDVTENFLSAFDTSDVYPAPNRSQQTMIRLKVSAIPTGVTITFPQYAGIFETSTSAGDAFGNEIVLTASTLPQVVYYRMAAASNPEEYDSISVSPTVTTTGPFPLAPSTISISAAMAPITTGTTATLFPQYVEGWETAAVEFVRISKAFSRGIFSWGYNGSGQLGDGTTDNRTSPVRVNNLSTAVALSTKGQFSLALKTDGTVWAWGDNAYGTLGNGTTADSSTPGQVVSLSEVKAISASDAHALAVKKDGTAWAWGNNAVGQLGNSGPSPGSTIPVQVMGISNVVGVSGGSLHSLALKSDGTVWRWGADGYVLVPAISCGYTTDIGFTFTPQQVSGLSSVKTVAAGYHHNLALKNDGTVWAWGCNFQGDLGTGTLDSSDAPVQVAGLSGATSIAAGQLHSLALKGDGTVWAWGDNYFGQLGNGGESAYSSTPVQVSGLSGVVAIAAGRHHSMAIRRDGTVWAWGINDVGQLGDKTTTNSFTPVQVRTMSHAVAIAAGAFHGLVYATTTHPFFDTDRDASSDISVFRSDEGIWYTLPSGDSESYTLTPWGTSGDVPVAGDYDGDWISDIAVWRPDTGVWYALPSSAPGTYTSIPWGLSSDVPVQGDYDGDGKDDVAVWRPENGTWYMLQSGTPGAYTFTQWGVNTDIAIPGDYDGDGKTDIAVWRPANGVWYILASGNPGTYTSIAWGLNDDFPVPGDYDGDGSTDIAVWRQTEGNWYIMPSASPGTYAATQWGLPTDVPVSGDFDGDGKTDIAAWRPSEGVWYIILSGSPGTYTATQWGLPTDEPISPLTGILRSLP